MICAYLSDDVRPIVPATPLRYDPLDDAEAHAAQACAGLDPLPLSLAELEVEELACLNRLGVLASLIQLSQNVSKAFDLPLREVQQAIGEIPENLLPLMESPQGWLLISRYVADRFGSDAHISPAVH